MNAISLRLGLALALFAAGALVAREGPQPGTSCARQGPYASPALPAPTIAPDGRIQR